MERHVIIGNGIAGISAAETIRSIQPRSSICVIAEEPFPPYSRPMISLVLEGRIGLDRLPIRAPDFYRRLEINSIIGEKVISIEADRQRIITDQGQIIEYDRLLIATGANPRPIKAKGTDLGNVSFFRTEAHVQNILQALPTVKNAIVLGGGLVGFKAAYGLMRRGIRVTMLIRSGYPLSMQIDELAGQLIMRELRANGLEIKTGLEATEFIGNNVIKEAHLSDGSVTECQLVMIGKGVMPAIEFVPRDKIEIDLGIVVDDHLQTSIPGVFAAGDVAQAMDIVRKQTWVNAIWPVAAEQGIVAGANMAGRSISYRGSLGRNVIRIFGLDMMSAGIVNPPQNQGYKSLSRLDPFHNIYRKITLLNDTLVGMIMVGNIEQGGVIISIIHRQLPLTVEPELLLEPGFNFSTLLAG
ncbi:MAG: NAD(P)/FAD-dependent oxidoreductase [Desulfomonilaceae bacterium]